MGGLLGAGEFYAGFGVFHGDRDGDLPGLSAGAKAMKQAMFITHLRGGGCRRSDGRLRLLKLNALSPIN
jgi:hypothetical protein